MKTSIENRIKIIVYIALLLLGLMGAITLYYSSTINSNIEQFLTRDIKTEHSAQKMKESYYDLKAVERIYLYFLKSKYEADGEVSVMERIKVRLKNFETTIKENKENIISQDHIAYLDLLTENLTSYNKVIRDTNEKLVASEMIDVSEVAKKLKKLREDQDNIVNKVLALSSQSFLSHEKYIDQLVTNANRNLIFLMTIALLACLAIVYMAPQKVTRPIKSYINAIKELRELKFETRLSVKDNNELTELGEEINKFIDSFIGFDEMKRKKIQFEKRKFQVLADILNLGVVLISIEGEVLYLNAQMAKFLDLSTESFQKKDFHFVRLPDELKELFEDAIAKKEKFENRMIILTYERVDEDEKEHQEAVELLVDAGVVRNYMGDVANIILTFEDISNKPQNSIFKRISFRKM